jgi:DNA-nicking Smr family endonuclease
MEHTVETKIEPKKKLKETTKEVKRKTNKKTTLSINSETHEKLSALKSKIEGLRENYQIHYDAILSYLLDKIGDKDINRIFEGSLSPADKVQIEYEKYCEKNGKIDFWEWNARKLKIQ